MSATASVVSAELADSIQEADTLSVLSALSLAIERGDTHIVRYCAQVLDARLRKDAEAQP